MGRQDFLVLNLALGFYNVGTIWAHEVDIFRSWRLVDRATFHQVQRVHWRKLPYWVLGPVAIGLLGAIALVGYHPAASPSWAIAANLGCRLLSIVLTAFTWGRWQAALARDPLGPQSPYLARILATHWIRTLLVNASAVVLLLWTIAVI